tara:strand:- start:33 stop:599 length:567 start_codon:yes stop_codon:yes gene_type:complete
MANGTLKVSNIETSSGSGTITIGQSGETVTIPSGATVSGAGANTPAFEAYGAEQTGISSSTWTKITFGTEVFDTDSMYDISAYRFTPTVAGKYFVYGGLSTYSDTSYQAYVFNMAIYKNGSSYKYTPNNANPSYDESERFVTTNATVVMNGSSDYVEIYGRCVTGSGTVVFDSRENIGFFGAYKIIGA